MPTPPPHRIHARRPLPVPAPQIDHAGDVLESYSHDAAHFPGGLAGGVAVPADLAEVSALISASARVLAVGAQSSLTGGATPRGDLVLSTRRLTRIGAAADGQVTVGAGVPLQELQRHLAAAGLYYPPAPTFDGAFVGGTCSTNAAGAATFKYGTTRQWVNGVTVVLADGSVLDVRRGSVVASAAGVFEVETPEGRLITVPVPRYIMPAVPKLSAGYYAAPGMDLVDLFVGSEGTLGVIVDATLRVIPRPVTCAALIACADEAAAIAITAALRADAKRAWRGADAVDVSAIEYMDAHSLALVADDAFARAGVQRPSAGGVLLLVQIELRDSDDPALERLQRLLEGLGDFDPVIALPGDADAATRLFGLREAVPASVNAVIGRHKQRVPGIQKLAGDCIVPFDRLGESLALYRNAFERRGLGYAIWGHVSDGNLHPNAIATSLDEVARATEAIHEIARGVVALGGAPLAEHGVGRSPLKQLLLRDLYGEDGIEQMRAVKRELDPGWKLAPGVLFSEA